MKSLVDTRPAAVAGTFYPAQAERLQTLVLQYLQKATEISEPPKALIVPHAGYVYSGPIAGSSYRQALKLKDTIRSVVLLGPAHRVYFQGLASVGSKIFATPLGNVEVDLERLHTLESKGWIHKNDKAHEQEHSLEVQLPFLQVIFGSFKLVPILVGDAKSSEVERVLKELWGEKDTLIVISSDLSHYLDYESAIMIDRQTSHEIEILNEDGLDDDQACGCRPIRGLLRVAKQKKLKCRVLDVRNSGDTSGDHSRVVGYGAFAFYEHN